MAGRALQLLQNEIFATVIKTTIVVGASYCLFTWALRRIDSSTKRRVAAQKKVISLLQSACNLKFSTITFHLLIFTLKLFDFRVTSS